MKKVEAVLFSSENPMRVGEIGEIIGHDSKEVSKAVKKLRKEYENRGGAIEIAKIGNKYVMQLKEDYLQYGYRVGKREMSDEVLRTLAVIAYYQPITQSKLREFLGSRVYEYVDELKKRGFVYGKKAGKTIVLRTTKKFTEYFGIDASRPEEVKKFLEEKMGGEKNE